MEQRLWYKAKRYGWGWFPVTWEGWAVIAGYVIALTVVAVRAGEEMRSFGFEVAKMIVAYVLLTSALIITCYAHGEEPKWRWGKKK